MPRYVRLPVVALTMAVGLCGWAAAADWPPVPYPHPMITEVLFAVPTGDGGDASGDGSRHVSGDEFIELVNPHDKAIQVATSVPDVEANLEDRNRTAPFPWCGNVERTACPSKPTACGWLRTSAR